MELWDISEKINCVGEMKYLKEPNANRDSKIINAIPKI